jgi:4-hydroxybenzoate polyprenyltransferase and related prenyltransferases
MKTKVLGLLKLVRWTNLLMVVSVVLLIRYTLLTPYYILSSITVSAPTLGFALLLLSYVFLAASGYVINDFFDAKIDCLNKPDKVLVGKLFQRNETYFIYWILVTIGFLCSVAASFAASTWQVVLIYLLLALMLYSYSERYKRMPFVGNLIVALVMFVGMLMPWIYDFFFFASDPMLFASVSPILKMVLQFVLIYAAFAFMCTLVRELIKDMEDVEGDKEFGCRTLPIVWGLWPVKILTSVLLFVVLAGLVFCQYWFLKNGLKSASFSLLLPDALCVAIFVQLLNAVTKKQFSVASFLTKLLMLFGMVSMIFIQV